MSIFSYQEQPGYFKRLKDAIKVPLATGERDRTIWEFLPYLHERCIDILQPVYFVLPELKRLFDVAHEDIMAHVRNAMQLGLHQPKFPPKAA